MEDLVAMFAGRSVLVTGHTGFKGAWLCHALSLLGAELHGLSIAVPGDQRAGYHRLKTVDSLCSESISDVCDQDALGKYLDTTQPEVVLHLAAQALVSVGWSDPEETYRTNVFGTFSLLSALKSVATPVKSVVVVTSDKVYANNEAGRFFIESDPLGGHDPYSNSKACTELVVAGFAHGIGAQVTTVRAGNVIGGGDVSRDRLLPDMFRSWRAASSEQDWTIDLRRPDATRPWQHVVEPISGYISVAKAHLRGENIPSSLNFGPSMADAYSVRQVVDLTIKELGSGHWTAESQQSFNEASLLGIDPTLAATAVGWKPQLSLSEAIAFTVDWERHEGDYKSLRALSNEQFASVGLKGTQ